MGPLLAETIAQGIPRYSSLTQAASFGKAFLELYNSDQFVEMCRTLRVLNAVRDHRIGLPLSYNQYFRVND